MISPPRILVLIRQHIPSEYATSLKYLQLHISLLVIWREESRYDATLPYAKNTTYFERRQNTIVALERNPQIPHMRDLKGSYKGISEFYFENFAKLQNES
jgi:hypothetical protein